MGESRREIVGRSRLFACEVGLLHDPDCPCRGALYDRKRVQIPDQLYTLSPEDPHYPHARSKRGAVHKLARIRQHALEVNFQITPFLLWLDAEKQIRATITKAQKDVYHP